ncbi:thiol reductant ABC exporter subunit CydC [Halomonas litopenaei]|uniref:thiol reductant ABC exporter subunit CydC n=1 Tax=Halomonas litopenaei TaxID=2109328 RepID=UPI003FA09719
MALSTERTDTGLGAAIVSLRPWIEVHAAFRRRLVLGVVLMVLTALSALGLLAVSGWFITASALTGAALAAGMAATLDVYTPGAGIRLFAVSRTVSRYVERLYNHDTILRLLARLRARCFAGLVTMDGARLGARRSGDWLNRLTADIDTLDALYLRLLAPAAMALVLGGALVALVAVWLPQVALVLGVLLLFGWSWLTLGQARLGLVACRRRVAALERLRSAMIETLGGLSELESYGALERRRGELEALEDDLLAAQWRLSLIAGLGNVLATLVMGGAWWLVLVGGLAAFGGGQLGAAVLVMLPLASLALAEGLASLPAAFSQAGASLAAAERLNAIDQQRAAPANVSDTTRAVAASPASRSGTAECGGLEIRATSLSYRYPRALDQALSPLSFRLAPGERTALCGPSGSGKSTLLALLAGELRGHQGGLTLDGQPMEALDPQWLSSQVGCLTQRVELFDASLAENLRLGAPKATPERLWQALSAVDLADWAQGLPGGLATRVGEGGRQLSGGQARRLGLARLWLTDPALVVLDEPFASLDAATARRVAEGIGPWLAGRTVLMLVHHHDPDSPSPGMEDIPSVIDIAAGASWQAQGECVTI